MFRRLDGTAITAADAALIATWTGLKAATDATKVVPSAKLHNPSQDGGDIRTSRGGNASLGGVPITLGANPTTISAEMLNVPQAAVASLRKLACEGNLGVYLVNAQGAIAGRKVGSNHLPFPIVAQSLFVGDKVFGNYDDADMNAISWVFAENWSDDYTVVSVADGNIYDLI